MANPQITVPGCTPAELPNCDENNTDRTLSGECNHREVRVAGFYREGGGQQSTHDAILQMWSGKDKNYHNSYQEFKVNILVEDVTFRRDSCLKDNYKKETFPTESNRKTES